MANRNLPARVSIREVGPRDGLQPEEPIAVSARVGLIDSLQDAGLTHIEVAAFVSPKAVPAMAGAAEVLAGIDRRPGSTYAALVPNLKGAELALSAEVDELTVTLSASEGYNQRNVRMSLADSEKAIAEIVRLAADVPTDAVVSCAFGSPYEGDIAPSDVAALAKRLLDAGVTRITCADTTGMATPRRIDDLLDALGPEVPDLGLHLHNTRETALVNAYAALERGIARFDTAVGGLGGSPFAHGAGGNLATESLVALLDDLMIESGIAIDRLIESARLVEDLVGRPVPSPILRHGTRDASAD